MTASIPPNPQIQPLTVAERDALKKEYAQNGCFVLRDVVSPERLAALHQDLADAFDDAQRGGALFSGGGLVSGHLNCFPGEGARFVYETLEARGIVDLIRELHPAAARMPNVGCNFNLPGSHTQHWHTDRDFAREFIIANVALVDTTIANGATDLIPGTHKSLLRYWQFVVRAPYRRSIRMEIKRGDLMVRSSNVWHRGMPNRTAVPRPMLAFTWEDGGSTQADPFAVDGGKIAFKPNWFRPTRMGRLREQLFVRVPVTYAALRFFRSLVDKNY